MRASPFVTGRDGRPPKATEKDLATLDILDGIDTEHAIADEPAPIESWVQRMQIAALLDAMRVLKDSKDVVEIGRAMSWVRGTCRSERGFSLREICESLDFRHERVRALLLSGATKALPRTPRTHVRMRMVA